MLQKGRRVGTLQETGSAPAVQREVKACWSGAACDYRAAKASDSGNRSFFNSTQHQGRGDCTEVSSRHGGEDGSVVVGD